MIKKQIVIIVCIIICFVLTGCQNSSDNADDIKNKLKSGIESKMEKEAAADSEETETEPETKPETISEESPVEKDLKDDSGIDYEALYEPVFTEILEIIDYGYNIDREYEYASGNLTDMIDSGEKDNPLDQIGYRLEDISGDGVPELLVGYDADYMHNGGESYVAGIYTVKDGKPFTAYAGSARSGYMRMDDSHFFYTGNINATFMIMGKNHLAEDGTEIIWDDCYFSDEKSDGTVGYYHNQTGIINAEQSDEMKISGEDFNKIMDGLAGSCIRIEWTPIGNCEARGETGSTTQKEMSSDSGEAWEPYCGVLYWYKDLQTSGKSWEEMEKYNSKTALVQYGWPYSTNNEEVRFVYRDITGDGYDELIITYNGDPVDIYSNEGDAVYSYGVPYRAIAEIYPDGTIMEGLSAGTKGWISTWYKYDEKTYKYAMIKEEPQHDVSPMTFTGGNKIDDITVPDNLKGLSD